MGSSALQSVFSSHGSGAQNSLLRVFIVQASRRPGHLGDKRALLKAPCERKYLFTQSIPTNVILRSTAGSLGRWKCGALTDVVRTWSDKWEVGDMCHPKLEDAEVPAFLWIFHSFLHIFPHFRMALNRNTLTFFFVRHWIQLQLYLKYLYFLSLWHIHFWSFLFIHFNSPISFLAIVYWPLKMHHWDGSSLSLWLYFFLCE